MSFCLSCKSWLITWSLFFFCATLIHNVLLTRKPFLSDTQLFNTGYLSHRHWKKLCFSDRRNKKKTKLVGYTDCEIPGLKLKLRVMTVKERRSWPVTLSSAVWCHQCVCWHQSSSECNVVKCEFWTKDNGSKSTKCVGLSNKSLASCSPFGLLVGEIWRRLLKIKNISPVRWGTL